jgi:hypothetical protein
MTKTSKHPGGRPVKYSELDEFQKKIDEYFDFCDARTKEIHSEKNGDLILPDPEPYTMSGLAYALNLSRQGLIDYSKKDKFFDAVKRARNRVEKDIERRMNDKNTFTPGLIFNAKNNFGWKDKTETDITTGGKPLPIMGGSSNVHNNTSIPEDKPTK